MGGFLLICFYPIVMKSKLSKAMKEKQEEAKLVKNDTHNTISYQELRKILLVVSEEEESHKNQMCTPQNGKNIIQSNKMSVTSERSFLDELSIEDLDITLVDFSPAYLRVNGVNSMLKKSKIVILHDSEEQRYPNLPKDFKYDEKFSKWND